MNETPVEYRERIFRTLGTREPLEVLSETPVLLTEWMDQYDVGKWKSAPAGVWSAAQVLSHLAEGEIVAAYRIRMIARNSGTTIQGFDQDVWVKNSDYLIQNPSLALKVYTAVRAANLEYIRSLPPSAQEHFGIHSERGKETIKDVIRMYAGHDLNHLRQIEQRLTE